MGRSGRVAADAGNIGRSLARSSGGRAWSYRMPTI